jgi:DNA-binding transcriptional MerR regulator
MSKRTAGPEDGRGERFLVGDAARFFGISPDLVRYYEKTGLVSPSSTSGSGYRQYSFIDLIKLNYVRALRSLDFRLDDIGKFIEARDLAGQASMLAEKAKSVEARIRKLEGTREELLCYRKGIEEIARLLDRFEALPSPVFACSSLGSGRDPFMIEAHERLNACGLARGGTYSISVRVDYFSGSSFSDCATPVCSGLWIGKAGEVPPEGIELFRAPHALHTVFASREEVTPADLDRLAEGVRAQGATVAGDALLQYLAFEREGEGFVDYIEAWIPVK